MHFGRVKIGDHYSVSPEATLGPTVREMRDYERRGRAESEKRAIKKRIASQRIREFERSRVDGSRVRESTVREFESRRFESSRVRDFELDGGVIPTVKSETNKESERLSG
jgi:hypothetical protein